MKKQLLSLSSLICLVNIVNGQISFDPAVNYSFISSPKAIITADFDSDGNSDIATAVSNNTVWVQLNNGDGTFAAAVNYTVGPSPSSIIAGDFDGNGSIDLAASNQYGNNVSVLLNNGDGTFNSAVNYSVSGSTLTSVTTADFDNDGNLDLAITGQGSNNVCVLLGTGNGVFGTDISYGVGSFPSSVTSADFNQDGNMDLVASNLGSNNVSILFGIGDGTFSSTVNYNVGTGPTAIVVEDFNEDGVLDLACSNSVTDDVSVLLGTGGGGFNSPISFGADNFPFSINAADFNFDGNVDLAVVNANSNNVSVLLGNGAGTFASPINFAVGSTPYSVASADFNGDGKMDLTTANNGANNISVLLNNITPVTGAALNFDGINDRVNIGSSLTPILNSSNKITVEAWVNPSTNAGYGCIIGNYNTSNSDMQFLLRRDGTSYSFYLDNGGGFTSVSSTTPITIGVWQHVAGMWDGTTLSIYVDGVLSNSTSLMGTNIRNITNPIWIGANQIGENFNGSIDEVRIWNRAMCAAEILNNTNGELPLPQVGLLAYYQFNQGLASISNLTETSLADSSSNSVNGSLDNFDLMGSTSNWIAPGAVTSGVAAPSYTFLSATIASQTNVSCNGGNNGAININANGGTPSYTYLWSPNGETSSNISGLTTGFYTVTITDANNCTANQSISITEPAALNTTTSKANETITANATGVTYQWIDCNNSNSAIAGATGQSYTATVNGNYAVIVTNGACSDTSSCVSINSVGIISNSLNSLISIYPNPTSAEIMINFPETLEIAYIIVRNVLGQTVYTSTLINEISKPISIDGEVGIYFIEITNKKGERAIVKVVKE
jgi:hypothetical protein